MTYREKYNLLKKIESKYINNTVIKSVLMDDGSFNDFTSLIMHFNDTLKNEKRVDDLIKRILDGEPLQYVLGYAFFINSNYIVTPDVLIPRQETEQLAIGALFYIKKYFPNKKKLTIVDVGTGSGILAIYLKENFTESNVIAVDISEKALEIAHQNAKLHNVSIDFRLGDILEPVNEKIDVIISNPPYILNAETVDEQTLKYEPHLALFSNPPIKFYEKILSNIPKMKNEFFIAFEIGEDMKDELTNLLENKYQGIGYNFEKDIYGKDRFLYILKKKDFDKYA